MAGDRKIDPATNKRLEEFRSSVAKEADEVIFGAFPSKVSTRCTCGLEPFTELYARYCNELQELIHSTSTASSPFHLSHAADSTDSTVYPPPQPSSSDEPDKKKRKREAESESVHTNGISNTQNARYPDLVLLNKHLVSVHQRVKRECEELAELCDKIKLWINLTMPKIEDGDNFGVQIQEEVLNELHRSQESAYNMRDTARQSYLNRAKICSKIIKYPHVEDYTMALKEHDEKQLYLSRQHLFDLRNIYAVMTDILHKNMSKIRAPKANNGVGLY
ncbi:proteasome activator pa28 REG alpha/beta subunit [Artomyces pyxidatus]|uniref:Proteasome activator pa28 REG alpha/beta subunit n=1 Tax=Artomyces pyxidatus TaxID=48021 RepID=A0ACB8TCR6_9AGAM|nr:proteasome activator pa28 REG alpha/beta subunit [Artomyces pyxidatus]